MATWKLWVSSFVIWTLCAAAPAASAAEVGVSAQWVFFRDRGLASSGVAEALEERRSELSPRAIARRMRERGDAGLDERDLPPNAAYIQAVIATGVRHRSTSRWLNAISVEADESQRAAIASLPFVSHLQPVASRPRPELPPSSPAPIQAARPEDDYGVALEQLGMIGVPAMHECGLTGAGVVVAVQDTGFQRDHVAFAQLDVLDEYDFINGDGVVSYEEGDPESQHRHGTSVLSLVAGSDPGNYMGVAPDVTVLLSKTEDTSQEEPIEEDWFVEGLEWAEASGADLLTASLCYYDWYSAEDMDGQTAVTTIAATIAVGNGLILINSAGNSGPEDTTIGAPADADGLIAVGAVDIFTNPASFTSRGPTADGRIKPDVSAPGVDDWVVDPDTIDEYKQGSGTSYAAPMTAGVVALMLQAFPDLGPAEMRELLTSTASQANNPDNTLGWGIVDAVSAAGLYCTCQDYDEDGFYDASCGGLDCDDYRAEVNPDAEEICDGFDNDCDGELDEGEDDLDGDGYLACNDDCDDEDADSHPGAAETAYDGVDQDCDGEDLVDVDEDGVPGPDEDCNDEDEAIHPGAIEICDDGQDNDCDGLADAADLDCYVPPDPGVVLTGDGCQCDSTATLSGGGWLLLAGLVLAIRRRR